MKKRDKKGDITIKTFVEYCIAILVLLTLAFFVLPIIYGMLLGGNEEVVQAKRWVNYLADNMEGLGDGESTKFLIFGPKNWKLIYFEKQETNKYAKRPNICFASNCLCICKPKLFAGYDCELGACRIISKDVEIDDLLDVRIDLKVSSNGNFKVYSFNLGISPAKLTDYRKLKLEKCKIAFEEKGYEKYIDEASKGSKEQEAKIKAVSCWESDVKEKAVSCAGAVGLMQLMPATARMEGLDVPAYGIEDISYIGLCKNDDGYYTKVSKCNKVHPGNCDYENDQRFDPRENIIAGAKFLAGLEEGYDSFDQVLAAYNWGGGNLKKKCPSLNIGECVLPPETAKYVPGVLSFYEYFATA